MSNQDLLANTRNDNRKKHSVQNTPSQSPTQSLRRPSEVTLLASKTTSTWKAKLGKDWFDDFKKASSKPQKLGTEVNVHSQKMLSPFERQKASQSNPKFDSKPIKGSSLQKSTVVLEFQATSAAKLQALQIETGSSPALLRESRSNPKLDQKVTMSKGLPSRISFANEFSRSPTVEEVSEQTAPLEKLPNVTSANTPTNRNTEMRHCVSRPSIKKILTEAQSGSHQLAGKRPQNIGKDLKVFKGILLTSVSILGLVNKTTSPNRPYAGVAAKKKTHDSLTHLDLDVKDKLSAMKTSFTSKSISRTPYSQAQPEKLAASNSSCELQEFSHHEPTMSNEFLLKKGISTEGSVDIVTHPYETSVDLYVSKLAQQRRISQLPVVSVKDFNVYQEAIPDTLKLIKRSSHGADRKSALVSYARGTKDKSSSTNWIDSGRAQGGHTYSHKDNASSASGRSSSLQRGALHSSFVGPSSWAQEIAHQSASRSSIHSKSFLSILKKETDRKTVLSPQKKKQNQTRNGVFPSTDPSHQAKRRAGEFSPEKSGEEAKLSQNLGYRVAITAKSSPLPAEMTSATGGSSRDCHDTIPIPGVSIVHSFAPTLQHASHVRTPDLSSPTGLVGEREVSANQTSP